MLSDQMLAQCINYEIRLTTLRPEQQMKKALELPRRAQCEETPEVSSVDIIPTPWITQYLVTPIVGQLLREWTSGLSMNMRYLGLQKTS